MKRIACLFVAFVCCFWAWGQMDSMKLNQLIQQLPEGSEVGISVYDLTAGKSIYVPISPKQPMKRINLHSLQMFV